MRSIRTTSGAVKYENDKLEAYMRRLARDGRELEK